MSEIILHLSIHIFACKKAQPRSAVKLSNFRLSSTSHSGGLAMQSHVHSTTSRYSL
jgi:hypothetical protein